MFDFLLTAIYCTSDYINYNYIYILKHQTVVPFQYVYSQLHLFQTSASVPILS